MIFPEWKKKDLLKFKGYLLDDKQDRKCINYYNNRKTSEGNYKNGEKVWEMEEI